VDALRDAGVPSGAISLVTNDPKDAAGVVEELIAHPAVRRISFTGSTRVGRIIGETAARHLKRVLLELGGNAPLVVLADADLERAVAAATFGSFMHQGQICMSTERIVIDRSVADEFAQKLAERASSLKVGDPREPDTKIGPLVNEDALKRVREHVEDAVAKGATLVTGGKAIEPKRISRDEVRAKEIAGGEVRHLVKGDVMVIPKRMPHWFKEVKGPFLYYVVKVTN